MTHSRGYPKLKNKIISISGGPCKSLKKADFVIPTKVGIQSFQYIAKPLDSRFHGNDDFCKSLSK